jgi:predicted molibdopterin-dependent oxidoreductase YjgC
MRYNTGGYCGCIENHGFSLTIVTLAKEERMATASSSPGSLQEIQTTCCYCGAGCQLLFTVDKKANKILDVHPVKG